MSSRAAARKADIIRAVEAVKAAGFSIASVEVRPDGTIRVVTSDGKDLTKREGADLNPWDYS